MKAEELRIGNLITDIWASEGSAFEVVRLSSKHQIIKYGAAFSANLKNIKGIPLTEEWLVKFGFEMTKRTGWFDKEITASCGRRLGFMIKICPNGSWALAAYTDRQTEIKYVHQLQNLYFALIGEELTPNKTDKK